MKKYIYKLSCLKQCASSLYAGLLIIIFWSCDVLDKKPLDVINEDLVWSDEKLIDADLTGAYISTTVFNNEADDILNTSKPFFSIFFINNISDESKSASNFSGNAYKFKSGKLTIAGGLLEYWERPYAIIRALNDILERLPSANVSNEFKTKKAAEARFLRAYNYFAIVKRYGGCPLLTKVSDKNDKKPKRAKEKEVYDFIISEAKEISNIFPETVNDSEWGRPGKYAALALASRAALYAGSIAQYGTVQLGGVVGIDNGLANQYYKEAYDASKAIINGGKHRLYAENSDKVQNFKDIFLKKRNTEVIFAIQHDGSDKNSGGAGWCYDYFQCPFPNGWSNGNHDAPYLETIEAFEHIDGTPGTLDMSTITNRLITMDELWKDMDPRFFATFYTQGTAWQGRTINYYNGLRIPDASDVSGYKVLNEGSHQGVLANGEQRFWAACGFGVMKYLDEKKDNGNSSSAGIFGSSQDFILFRYAEILLNYAEAAIALGLNNEALDAVNQIRNRAGIAPLTSIDVDKIRHERRVELAFEGHRYWDLRRWRIAEDYLSRRMSGLRFTLDYDTRKFLVQKVENIEGDGNKPLFRPENYYFPITKKRTSQNPNLVENPGYQ